MAIELRFPETINETSARIVAAGVTLMGLLYLASGSVWVLVPLTYGFFARVAFGPTFSPLARLATQVITPRLGGPHRLVAGVPKRFAQAIGAALTATALVLHVSGSTGVAAVAIALLVGAAGLEATMAFCLGCRIFAFAMRAGLVPAAVCDDCADISRRLAS